MKLENEFTVPASVDDAWKVLLDVERVAPCLPGAEIEKAEGDSYNGTMTVKIGPITAKYKGTIEIQEADEAAHRAVMKAKARDARGQGGAQATITSTMESADDGTRVKVETDMRVTGAAAQFGRGVMQDVSAQMMGRFADCLASEMSGDGARAEPAEGATPEAEEAAASSTADAPTAAPLPDDVPTPPGAAEQPAPPSPAGERPTPDVLDLGEVGRGVLAKRAGPAVGVLAGVLVLLFVLRRLLR
jgi:carbon monoxide dehydrogenase subunit G